MPAQDDPSYPRWSAAIRREMAVLNDGTVVAGHSVGGTILIHAIAEQPPAWELAAIGLIAALFFVHIFHGLDDETAPPEHADLYARAIPRAQVHRLPGRDHQLNNDLSEAAQAIGRRRPFRR